MKTLICGAGPIGCWLALRLERAGKDVTLLARGAALERIEREGVELTARAALETPALDELLASFAPPPQGETAPRNDGDVAEARA